MEGVPLGDDNDKASVLSYTRTIDIYLDLEASRLTNPNVDFDVLFSNLLAEFQMFLKQMSITGCEDATIVVLDSSNTKKFSKHVIIRFKESVFANNYVCGALMRNFHLHLLRRFGEPDTNMFYIHPEEAAVKQKVKKCLLDFAVYTQKRMFLCSDLKHRLGTPKNECFCVRT